LEVGTNILVRARVDRRVDDDEYTIKEIMDDVRVDGVHCVEVADGKGGVETVGLEIKYRQFSVLPPIGKRRKHSPITLTVVTAVETTRRKKRKPLEWRLVTNLPVKSCEEAIEKVKWYALRWNIETFHKVLKSGCRVEKSQLRTAERLTKMIATKYIIGWRIFFMTKLNRVMPGAEPEAALTKTEIEVLDLKVRDKPCQQSRKKTLSDYLVKIARLGGYLGRRSDRPPGNIVMWRGIYRLHYTVEGFVLHETAQKSSSSGATRSESGKADTHSKNGTSTQSKSSRAAAQSKRSGADTQSNTKGAATQSKRSKSGRADTQSKSNRAVARSKRSGVDTQPNTKGAASQSKRSKSGRADTQSNSSRAAAQSKRSGVDTQSNTKGAASQSRRSKSGRADTQSKSSRAAARSHHRLRLTKAG